MQGQRGFWDVEDRLKEISAEGDPLERLARTVDFELFRPVLTKVLGRRDPANGGRPSFDPVLKFKMLVLGAMHGLSLQQTEAVVAETELAAERAQVQALWRQLLEEPV